MAGRVKMIVVGDFPTQSDLDAGEMFHSRRDQLLHRVMKDVCSVDLSAVDFDMLFDDTTKPDFDGPGMTQKERDAHMEVNAMAVVARVAQEKPLSVIAVGSLAMAALTGVSAGQLQKNRGKILELKGHPSIKVIPVYEPSFVERAKHLMPSFAGDVMRAWNIASGATSGVGKTNVTLVRTREKFDELMAHVRATQEFCFDFETSGLDVNAPDFFVTMLSVAFQHGGAWIVPLHHPESPFAPDEVYDLMSEVRNIMADENIRKTGHNVKYDLKVMISSFGIFDVRGRLDDTMLMKHLWDETTPNGLKDLVAEYFPAFAGYEDEMSRYKWGEHPLNILAEYAACDADLTLRLRTLFEQRLLTDPKRYVLYRNLSMSLLPVLADVESRGMLIDSDQLKLNINRAQELIDAKEVKLLGHPMVKKYWARVAEIQKTKQIEAIEVKLDGIKPLKAGGRTKREIALRKELTALKLGQRSVEVGQMNFSSPVQLGGLLYTEDGFGYPEQYDPRKGANSRGTGRDILVRLKDDTGFIEDLLTYRSLTKTRSTYLVGILERLDSESMVHTEFLQHGAKSGRLSSRDPNLQNIPDPGRVRWEEAKEVAGFVKGVFTVPQKMTMVAVDFSQAELRLMAMYAKEETMLEAYANNVDIHTLTACKMNGITLEQFKALPKEESKTMRYHAKAGNFGLIYGMSAEGFKEYAENDYGIKMSQAEAERIRNTFFKTYPGILDYHDLYIQKAQTFGGVRTLFGRFRHTPAILDASEYRRAEEERVAVNSVIQGTAAELTMLAMVLCRQRLDPRIRLVNTVHDSIFFYVPDKLLDEAVRIIRYTCTELPTEQYFGRAIEGVSMAVDVEITKENWKNMVPYEG